MAATGAKERLCSSYDLVGSPLHGRGKYGVEPIFPVPVWSLAVPILSQENLLRKFGSELALPVCVCHCVYEQIETFESPKLIDPERALQVAFRASSHIRNWRLTHTKLLGVAKASLGMVSFSTVLV